ncbi:MAG: tRNA pseudouridine(54/55) synthase Pus10 [Candidatus Thorarchaeota archaeon]
MEEERPRVITTAQRLLEKHPICDQCLGRQVAWLSTDTTNRQRGASLKLVLTMMAEEEIKHGSKEEGIKLLQVLATNGMLDSAKKVCKKYGIEVQKDETCHLCGIGEESVFDKIPSIVQRVQERAQNIEFATFLVGTEPDLVLAEREDELRGQMGLADGEALKSDFNRELGKQIEKALKKEVDFQRPDIVVFYKMAEDKVQIRINPVFIYGRYRKLVRGIPQSRWDCSECKGKGCDACGGTGRKYPESVSEFIGTPSQKELQGTKFKVHAAGREDIDVLMLGTGRPFVVEISRPNARNPDLEHLTSVINQFAEGKVEVSDLRITTRRHFQVLKNEASENEKEYHAIIQVEREPEDAELEEAVKSLSNTIIEQRTPNRVAHRRSDLIRKKRVLEVRLIKVDKTTLEGFFKVQGGTYVKELVSGDEGRTTPSLSEVLGIACVCMRLDVTAIHSLQTDHNL